MSCLAIRQVPKNLQARYRAETVLLLVAHAANSLAMGCHRAFVLHQQPKPLCPLFAVLSGFTQTITKFFTGFVLKHLGAPL